MCSSDLESAPPGAASAAVPAVGSADPSAGALSSLPPHEQALVSASTATQAVERMRRGRGSMGLDPHMGVRAVISSDKWGDGRTAAALALSG